MSLKKRFIGRHIFDADNPGVHIAFDNLIYQEKRISVGNDLFNFVNVHHEKESVLAIASL